jgi:hypothetical protein
MAKWIDEAREYEAGDIEAQRKAEEQMAEWPKVKLLRATERDSLSVVTLGHEPRRGETETYIPESQARQQFEAELLSERLERSPGAAPSSTATQMSAGRIRTNRSALAGKATQRSDSKQPSKQQGRRAMTNQRKEPGRSAIEAGLAFAKFWVASCKLTVREAQKCARPDIEERAQRNLKSAEAKRDEIAAELGVALEV